MATAIQWGPSVVAYSEIQMAKLKSQAVKAVIVPVFIILEDISVPQAQYNLILAEPRLYLGLINNLLYKIHSTKKTTVKWDGCY